MCRDNTANRGNIRKRKCVWMTQQKREEMCIDDIAEVLMCIEDAIGSGGQRTEEEERKVR